MLLHLSINIAKGFEVDYMHTLLLLDPWLSKENKDKAYFIGAKVSDSLINLGQRHLKNVIKLLVK